METFRSIFTHFIHPIHLTHPVYPILSIQKTYACLSFALVFRCLRGSSSNANESIHATVWRRANKAGHSGKTRLEMAVAVSTLKWNYGNRGILALMSALSLEYSQKTLDFFEKEDANRLAQARRRKTEEYCRTRKERKNEKKKRDVALKKKEGISYLPGGFWLDQSWFFFGYFWWIIKPYSANEFQHEHQFSYFALYEWKFQNAWSLKRQRYEPIFSLLAWKV